MKDLQIVLPFQGKKGLAVARKGGLDHIPGVLRRVKLGYAFGVSS